MRILVAVLMVGLSASCGDTAHDAAGSLQCTADAPPTCSDARTTDGVECHDVGLRCSMVPGQATCVDAPTCPDSTYGETLDNSSDLTTIFLEYTEANWRPAALAMLETRYPTGYYLVTEAQRLSGRDCLDEFTRTRRATASDLALSLSAAVHECGHFLDIAETEGTEPRQFTYVLREDLQFSLPTLATFSRSAIYPYTDPQDQYRDTYLAGASGMQGFEMLVEEFVQYTHALLVTYSFAAELPDTLVGMTSRDGTLTFMRYLQLFLRHARQCNPEAHAAITANAEWRAFLLTIWGQAELALAVTEDLPVAGIRDDEIESEVYAPESLFEIDILRDAEGCLDAR